MNESLRLLLDYLDAEAPQSPGLHAGWRIVPVAGGANNLLYRATSAAADYAVKFTVRDGRDRAGREYAALSLLEQAGLQIAPRAIALERERYRQPVVVQAWLDGAVLTGPPDGAADWQALLDHYCLIHRLSPADTSLPIAEATLNVSSGPAGRLLIGEHVAKIPPEERPPALDRLLRRFEAWVAPSWPDPPRAFCRVDPNWRNFIRRSSDWASVDWENSGWGDPAFELADMMTHPAYIHVAGKRWDWLLAAYAERRQDPGAILRTRTYRTILLVWWVVRWVRYLYEVPRGLDPRLAARPVDWRSNALAQYDRYLGLAGAALDG
jgi:aminoglycoside phosphotransferase (APT) family kinase protein